MSKSHPTSLFLIGLLLIPFALAACGSDDGTLTVYSGRSESLVQPLLDQFTEDTGIEVRVKYGNTSGTVALLLEEGDNTPADVVYLQDAGALGALALEGALTSISDATLDNVDAKFRSSSGEWVGTSGRARTVVYNVDAVDGSNDLPDSILDFTSSEWRGRVGWAPTNGSFQAFVTALRIIEGDTVARDWLEGMRANRAVDYSNNTSISTILWADVIPRAFGVLAGRDSAPHWRSGAEGSLTLLHLPTYGITPASRMRSSVPRRSSRLPRSMSGGLMSDSDGISPTGSTPAIRGYSKVSSAKYR